MTAVSITGAHHVTLKNLAIRHSRGNGVEAIHNATFVRVEGCDVSGHGQHGIVIVGSDSGVASSHVHSVGCAGIRVIGGDALTLTPGRCYATDNTVSNMALWKRTYNPGIFWNGVGNTYSGNTVRNSPHVCVLGGGNEGTPWGYNTNTAAKFQGSGSQCTFDNNTLDTCAYECSDCGAFYSCGQMGGAFTNRGNVLKHSTFTNIGAPGASASAAVYLDDIMSGWTVTDNTVRKAARGFLIGGGRRHKLLRNSFVSTDYPMFFDNRGMTFQKAYCQSQGIPAVQALLYKNSPWPVQYPELLNVTTDHECWPAHNLVADNTYDSASKAFWSPGGQSCGSDSTFRSWLSDAHNNTRV
jgi:hypothetical protein